LELVPGWAWAGAALPWPPVLPVRVLSQEQAFPPLERRWDRRWARTPQLQQAS